MNTVAIVGVGLIGGSFAMALRKAGFAGEILGVSSPQAIAAGLRAGAISRAATLGEAAASTDLIYLSQTVDRIIETLETLAPIAPRECLITDAGSTKRAIVEKASACLPFGNFLGGHPIAGKEKRGVEGADADLFRGRTYVLTPTAAETPMSQDFRGWLARIGANVMEMEAYEHDRALAFTSHLPQLLSTALAVTLAEQHNPWLSKAFGGSLLEMTRLAASSPDLWKSILSTNKTEVTAALDAIVAVLSRMRSRLQTDELSSEFTSAAAFAAEIRKISSRS